jgi:hypothetical protein
MPKSPCAPPKAWEKVGNGDDNKNRIKGQPCPAEKPGLLPASLGNNREKGELATLLIFGEKGGILFLYEFLNFEICPVPMFLARTYAFLCLAPAPKVWRCVMGP